MKKRDEKFPRRLLYGYTEHVVYTKHILPVKDIFWNSNFKCARRHNAARVYVSLDEKNAEVWDPMDCKRLHHTNFFETSRSSSVACLTYSTRFHVSRFLLFSLSHWTRSALADLLGSFVRLQAPDL